MNLLEKAAANQLKPTGEIKKLSIPKHVNDKYDVYAIPLKYLYYNDQNGRINTLYKKYSSVNGLIEPEIGDSEYNRIFEKIINESNEKAMKETKKSIIEKTQQEPGVVLADGRVIDGNRRLTALRMIEKETGISQEFNAVILRLDAKTDEKIIKELELDLQLGREERVSYDPIDRIFDVYNTIIVEEIMSIEEYKKASGAKNARGINRDIRLAELIIKLIEIISPGGRPLDKFYLARDLKLDGPIEEIERTITNLNNNNNKESIKEATLVYLATSKTADNQNDLTRIMREFKMNILQNNERLNYFLDVVDDKVDVIMEAFQDNPIQSANELKLILEQDSKVQKNVNGLIKSTNKIINKGIIENDRTRALKELESVMNSLIEIRAVDFLDLTIDEIVDARGLIKEINDYLYRLKREI